MKQIFFGALIFFSLAIFGEQGNQETPQPQAPPPATSSGIEFGGLGGPIFKVDHFGNGFLFAVGGRGAMTIASMFMLGGGGYGVISQTGVDLGGKSEKVSLGYGGLGFGFKLFPSAMVHLSNFNTFGIGRISLAGRNESSMCYTIEPELNAEFTFISFLRAGIGLSYRFLFANNISLPSKDLWGVNGQVYIEFGWL